MGWDPYFRRVLIRVLLMPWFFLASGYLQSAHADAPIAQVVWVKGTVKAIAPDKKERILKRGIFVYVQETLSTDKTSTSQVVFTDNSLLSLRENTQFQVREYKHSIPAKAGEEKFVANLVKGGFRTITGAISKENPENYKVNTLVATIGVRGTEYDVNTDSSGKIAVGVEHGSIAVSNEAGIVNLSPTTSPYAMISSVSTIPEPTKIKPPVLNNAPNIMPTPPSSELLSQAKSVTSGLPEGRSSPAAPGNSTTPEKGATSTQQPHSPSSSGGGGGGGGCGNLTIH